MLSWSWRVERERENLLTSFLGAKRQFWVFLCYFLIIICFCYSSTLDLSLHCILTSSLSLNNSHFSRNCKYPRDKLSSFNFSTYPGPLADLPFWAFMCITGLLHFRSVASTSIIRNTMTSSITFFSTYNESLSHTNAANFTARSPLIGNPSVSSFRRF